MHVLAAVAIAFVALSHVGFLVLEMFLWDTPTGRKVFRTTPEVARQSAALAANQGLYNGFLAAGLVWALWLGLPAGEPQAIFFLGCVIVAGLYGAWSVSPRILAVQAAPAALALALVLASS